MKKLLIVLVIVLCFAGVGAAEKTETKELPMDQCAKISELAGQIMKFRQSNAPMTDVVNIFPAGSPWIEIVIKAYEKPRMSVKENQQNMIQDFQNQLYLECVKAVTGGK